MVSPSPQLGAGNVTTVTATASTYTVDKPANLVTGDLLVGIPYGRNTGTWDTVPSGFTLRNSQTTVGNLAVFTKPIRDAGSEPATYAWHNTGGSSRGGIIMFRATLSNIGNPFDVAGAAYTNGTGIAPSVTPGKVDTLLLGVYVSNGTGTTSNTLSTPTGMTQISQLQFNDGTNFSTFAAFYQALSTTSATGTRTSTASPSGTSGGGFLTTFAPEILGAASLGASARSAESTQATLLAASSGSASARLTADTNSIQYASANLSATARILAAPQGTGYATMGPDGIWYPASLKQMIGGVWTE